MLYFAYGADLWASRVTNWTRDDEGSTLRIISHGPATLPNYRLAFPTFSEVWKGGDSAALAATGKRVSGLLLELPRSALRAIDQRIARPSNQVLRSARVLLYGGAEVEAMAYCSADDRSGRHYPPAPLYLDKLVTAAVQAGLSSIWVMQLLSFRPDAATSLELSGKPLLSPDGPVPVQKRLRRATRRAPALRLSRARQLLTAMAG